MRCCVRACALGLGELSMNASVVLVLRVDMCFCGVGGGGILGKRSICAVIFSSICMRLSYQSSRRCLPPGLCPRFVCLGGFR